MSIIVDVIITVPEDIEYYKYDLNIMCARDKRRLMKAVFGGALETMGIDYGKDYYPKFEKNYYDLSLGRYQYSNTGKWRCKMVFNDKAKNKAMMFKLAFGGLG